MAFLCPVRVRRDKKKATNANIERDLPILGLNHGLGRITGSSSIETLVRVGIEKEHGLSPDSKMVVLHDFTPCVDDELEVKRGHIVNILYRENDWVYVIGQGTRQEGFIPYSYCAPFNAHLADMTVKKKLPREPGELNEIKGDLGKILSGTAESINIASKLELVEDKPQIKNAIEKSSFEAECTPFHKEPNGRQIVLYTFIARDENDLSVERGEYVTLLNRDDPDWFWIMRNDGQEGFIPSSFVCPAESILQTQFLRANNTADYLHKSLKSDLVKSTLTGKFNISNSLVADNSIEQDIVNSGCTSAQQQISCAADDLQFHGTELVLLYDYKAQAPDDLSVKRGDWIYADLSNQTVDGWLWSYAPKTRKYGFIPKTYARPPAMTSL